MTGRPLMTGLMLAALVGAAGVLHAQGRDTTGRDVGMPEMMAMMEMCPMMAGMADGPEAALRHPEKLGLSDAQRRRLEDLRAKTRDARSAAMQLMRTAGRELHAAITREAVDSAAVRSAFRKMADAHAQVVLTVLAARRDTRDALSAEQRAKLAELAPRGRMEGMMGMMDTMSMMSSGGMRMMGDSAMGGRMDMMRVMMEHCPMMGGTMGDSTRGGRH